ncbi:hypothetical protein L6164_015459 [Bauhinia variegata]|uniref:Uncharacterized protein n=1 Tax=Bauhinia variegata TaxID=167791 RepID=A0ACB9NQJ8_BAUVA|nr:hypothetical protein L6164_015459 [Bauhinia variegata]
MVLGVKAMETGQRGSGAVFGARIGSRVFNTRTSHHCPFVKRPTGYPLASSGTLLPYSIAYYSSDCFLIDRLLFLYFFSTNFHL